ERFWTWVNNCPYFPLSRNKRQYTGKHLECSNCLTKEVFSLRIVRVVVRTPVGYMKINAAVSDALNHGFEMLFGDREVTQLKRQGFRKVPVLNNVPSVSRPER